MKRKTITAKMARDIILRQACHGFCDRWPGLDTSGDYDGSDEGAILCPLCKTSITPTNRTIWEHMHPLASGGADEVENIRLVHKECADKKTRGSGATTSGSDIGEIAKTKRMEKARHALENGIPKKVKAKIPGRKLQSRGFTQRKAK